MLDCTTVRTQWIVADSAQSNNVFDTGVRFHHLFTSFINSVNSGEYRLLQTKTNQTVQFDGTKPQLALLDPRECPERKRASFSQDPKNVHPVQEVRRDSRWSEDESRLTVFRLAALSVALVFPARSAGPRRLQINKSD